MYINDNIQKISTQISQYVTTQTKKYLYYKILLRILYKLINFSPKSNNTDSQH